MAAGAADDRGVLRHGGFDGQRPPSERHRSPRRAQAPLGQRRVRRPRDTQRIPSPRRPGRGRARRVRHRPRGPRVRRARPARARGAQGTLRRARGRAGQGPARGGNRRQELRQAAAGLALPAFLPRPGRAPPARRGRARDRLRRPVHRADPAAPGPRPLRRDRRGWRRRAGHERERGGRQHGRPWRRRQPAQHRRARRRLRPSQRHERRDRQLPARRRQARQHRRGHGRAASGAPTARGGLPRRQGLDRLPRPARDDPHRLVRGRARRGACPRA